MGLVSEYIAKVFIKGENSSFFLGRYGDDCIICRLEKTGFLNSFNVVPKVSEMRYNREKYIFVSKKFHYQIATSKGMYSWSLIRETA